MKRCLLFTLVIGLFAVQADAGLWELDRPTALGFFTYVDVDGAGGDTVGNPGTIGVTVPAPDLGIYDGPGLHADFGMDWGGYPDMSGLVGFVGGPMKNLSGGGDTLVTAGIHGPGPAADIFTYDGITSYFQNDNDDIWGVQLYYVDPTDGGTRWSGGAPGVFTDLAGDGGSTYLTANASVLGALTLANITEIGFLVQGNMIGLTNDAYPSSGDAFHMSVVPVPGAILLGILGLSAAGLKLRKFA